MIDVKRVIFHDMPDFILSTDQWHSIGGWKGFLKHNGIAIWQVKKVLTTQMPESKFFKLEPWEG